MPLYEYQCDSCGAVFERIRKFSDPPVEVCPTCGGSVKKLVSSPAFQFKGSGWYVTDYAKKSSGPAPSGESSGGSKSDKAERSDRSDASGASDKSDKSSGSATKDAAPAAAAPATPSTNKDK
jgi:putative FmdB family regulatory protein